MSLRILHLGKYYPPSRGGIESVVESLCRGESTWGQTQALVLSENGSTSVDVRDGVPVRRVGSVARIGAVSMAPSLPLWLSRAEADVMVLHEPNPMALVAYVLARPRIPLVVWYHSEVIRAEWKYRLFYQPFLDFALRRATRIVVASPPLTEVRALAPYRSKCVVVPFGLHVEKYVPDAAVTQRIEVLRQFARRPALLFVGRLVDYKGVDVLLKALPGLEADLAIVGDGPRRARLEALARELGVVEQVQFLGEVSSDELLARYHACDAFVLPSVTRQEAFGMVQLEAMACGRPVVSTDLGTGVAWVNHHGQTGLVVTPGDVEDLRGALARLIADEELRRRLGAQGRARVLNHFTAERMCSATRSLYLDIARAASYPTRIEPARVA